MPKLAIPAKGIKFKVKYSPRARQPWRYQVVGGNGEVETTSETFSFASDCARRIEGHWLGFCVAMGWSVDKGMPPPFAYHPSSDVHPDRMGFMLGFTWDGLESMPTLQARDQIHARLKRVAPLGGRVTFNNVKGLKASIDSMKIGGLSRKSLNRAIAKSAKAIQDQLIVPGRRFPRDPAPTPVPQSLGKKVPRKRIPRDPTTPTS